MKDDHKNDIDDYVHTMFSTIEKNKDKMKKIREDRNPSMADIDATIEVFGNYQEPTTKDVKE
jgi:hypothetical protein